MFLIRKSYRGMDEFKLIIIVKYDSSNGQIFDKKQMIRILMRNKSSNNWWVFENDLLFSEKNLLKKWEVQINRKQEIKLLIQKFVIIDKFCNRYFLVFGTMQIFKA